MNQPLFKGLLALTLLALLSACGNAPDEDVIRDALNRELQGSHLNALLEADDVEALNLYQEDDSHYTVDVHYRLRAKRDLSDYAAEVKADEERDAMDRFAMVMALAAVRVEFGDFTKGAEFPQERRIRLARSDDAWVIPQPPRPGAETP
jgi:hypothetical protein